MQTFYLPLVIIMFILSKRESHGSRHSKQPKIQITMDLQGYLVTILSDEENQISAEQAGGAGWIGASDQGIEGEWNWITGPEGLGKWWSWPPILGR